MPRTSLIWLAVGLVAVVIAIVLFVTSMAPGATPPEAVGQEDSVPMASTTPEPARPTPPAPSGGTAGAPAAKKPEATTIGFASVSPTTAMVVGTVVSNGSDTLYWFEYGTSLDFGSATPVKTVAASASTEGVAAYLTGLAPNTQYYFRLATKNEGGFTYGGPYSFVTPEN